MHTQDTEAPPRAAMVPAEAPMPCPGCADAMPAAPFVYAIGRIEARFTTLSAEKEFAQAAGRADTAGQTDQQTLHTVLSEPRNRYLARQMCWVLRIQGLETWLLRPRDAGDLALLIDAIRPTPTPGDVDVVIGTAGPVAGPDMCNGLMLPMLMFEQIYSFDRDTLMRAIPRPEKTTAAQFRPVAEELFERILRLTDNAGATDEHRALNYLAIRYPGLYARAAEQFGRNAALTGVEVRPSALGGTRRMVDVICAFTNRATDFTEKWCVRVDVTEAFPFLVTKLTPYYDH